MRVWLLTVGEPLPHFDGERPRLFRTGLLARALTARGHAVTWWTSAFDHYAKRHRVEKDTAVQWEAGDIRLLHSVGYPRNLSLRRFVEHAGVARKFETYARTLPRPDVIMSDLPTIELAHAAVRFGAAANVPVIIDVRDLWPDAIFDLVPKRLRWAGRLALRPLARRAREALQSSDGIVAVSEGYLRWGLQMAGRAAGPLDGVFPMGYIRPADVGKLGPTPDGMRAAGVDDTKTICWYVGSFGRTYDLAPLLVAARSLEQARRADVQFVISGEGELGARWRHMAKGLRNVVFTGWVRGDEISWLSGVAAIGLQPYVAGAPQGLPNKLFEYMSAGLPVVSSLNGECAQLLERLACGVTYKAGDAGDLLAKLTPLLDDDGYRRAMGARARAAFDAEFDGCVVLDRLAGHLERVARAP